MQNWIFSWNDETRLWNTAGFFNTFPLLYFSLPLRGSLLPHCHSERSEESPFIISPRFFGYASEWHKNKAATRRNALQFTRLKNAIHAPRRHSEHSTLSFWTLHSVILNEVKNLVAQFTPTVIPSGGVAEVECISRIYLHRMSSRGSKVTIPPPVIPTEGVQRPNGVYLHINYCLFFYEIHSTPCGRSVWQKWYTPMSLRAKCNIARQSRIKYCLIFMRLLRPFVLAMTSWHEKSKVFTPCFFSIITSLCHSYKQPLLLVCYNSNYHPL